jgi:hypothetical protein
MSKRSPGKFEHTITLSDKIFFHRLVTKKGK